MTAETERNDLIDTIIEASGWGSTSGYTKASRIADAIIARSSSVKGVEVPAAWRLVPEEAEQEQIDAMFDIHAASNFESPFGPEGSFAAYYRAAVRAAPTPTAYAPVDAVPDDVVRLVIAAREVAFGPNPAAAIDELDRASEAFASRVPWDDEPSALPPSEGSEP